MLEIKKRGQLFFDGQLINLPAEETGEFLLASFNIETKLSKGVLVEDVMDVFFFVKEYTSRLFSEEYGALMALTSTTTLTNRYKEIRVYKTFSMEEGKLFLYPNMELLEDDNGIIKLSKLPVVIDNTVFYDKDSVEFKNVDEVKCEVTLLDLMKVFFEDLMDGLKEGIGLL